MVNQTHGLRKLKNAIHEVAGRGVSIIDKRTTLGKELARWRAELVADLGGPEQLSTQQAAIVELAVRGKVLLDSVDMWLLAQPSLVDKRRRSVFPVLVQRQSLADGLLRHLTALGLGRQQAKQVSLSDYLAAHSEPSEAPSEQAKNHGRGDT